MSDDKLPKGPDFTQGVPAAAIAEGAMLAGRVGDRAALIARTGGTLYAIGAECSHYHGPLAEGLLVGETVRCPWHHACFDLKNGQAVGAPAFDAVTCWKVEEKQGKVFVVKEMESAAPGRAEAAAPKRAMIKRVVIIGGGAAGFAAAEMLRREGFQGDVALLSADRDAPYDRPNCSKDYLSGDAPKEWMPLRDDAFYRDSKIDLRLNTDVASFDPKTRTVVIKGGGTLPYDALILATGAEPQRPPIPGLDGPNVFMLRTLKDAEAIVEASKKAKKVAVIGASFIGLEVAASLKERGLDIHVIGPEKTPLEKTMGHDVGEWVKGVHEKKGVVFHLGCKVQSYDGSKIILEEGDPIEADFVVVGTGVRPRTALAEAAGLKVDNGVVTNDHLLTSAEGVYAAGDIARYPDPVSGRPIRVEHWVHAERQGQYLARLILGDDRPFADVPFFWSKHFQNAIHYSGHAEGFDPPEIDGSVAKGNATVRYRKDGDLLAVVTIDRDLESLKAERDFEERVQ